MPQGFLRLLRVARGRSAAIYFEIVPAPSTSIPKGPASLITRPIPSNAGSVSSYHNTAVVLRSTPSCSHQGTQSPMIEVVGKSDMAKKSTENMVQIVLACHFSMSLPSIACHRVNACYQFHHAFLVSTPQHTCCHRGSVVRRCLASGL